MRCLSPPRWLTVILLAVLAACSWPSDAESQWKYTDSIPATWSPTDSVPIAWRYTDSIPTSWRHTDSVPDTPPPAPCPCGQPAPGFTRITQNDFDGPMQPPGWGSASVGAYPPALKFLSEPGHTFGRITFPAGWPAGRSPVTTETNDFSARQATTLVVEATFRLSDNFYGENSSTNKFLHLGVVPAGKHWNRIFIRLAGKGAGPIMLQFSCQGTPNDAACANRGGNTGASTVIQRGTWNTVRFEMTTGGSVLMWLNGVQTHGYGGLDFGGAQAWSKVQLSTTWGGTKGVVPATMSIDVDRITVDVK